MKRVLCINAQPIEGLGNTELHLIKEGVVYDVEGVHPETGAYDIGIRTSICIKHDVPCYWGSERFLECQDDEMDNYLKSKEEDGD